MDLSSGTYYWPTLGTSAESLPATHAERVEGDVAVIGAGITGALATWTLTRAGFRVVVIDRGNPGCGSTVASTALIQYELDVSLTDLEAKIGWDDASAAYRLCAGAIERLGSIVQDLNTPCGFRQSPSLFVAKDRHSADQLKTEHELRRRAGLELGWVDASELASAWGLQRPGALLSGVGAEVNPFALTRALLSDAAARGALLVTDAKQTRWSGEKGRFVIDTKAGPQVRAPHLVIATGYEAQSILKERVVDLDSTFAIATRPLPLPEPWPHHALIWEDDDPYLYARCLSDGRLLIGGEDEPFENPALRDALIEQKASTIAKKFHAMMPRLTIEPQFKWAGTFGTTRDGLAYAGESPEYPGVHFALAFGGNGMTFAVLIAGFLADILHGRPPPELRLFRFGR